LANINNNIKSTYKIIYNKLRILYAKTPNNLFSLISGFILIFLIRISLTALDTIFMPDEYPLQRIIFYFSTTLLIMGFEIGYTKIIFNIIDNTKIKLSYIFNYFDLLGKYLITSILFYIILFISCIPCLLYVYIKYGRDIIETIISMFNDPYLESLLDSYFNTTDLIIIILLMFIPVLYLSVRCCLWSFLIIDKNYKPINSLKKSWDLTQNQESTIVVFAICLIIFNILGAISIIGLCLTAPLSYLFFCQYYRLLLHK